MPKFMLVTDKVQAGLTVNLTFKLELVLAACAVGLAKTQHITAAKLGTMFSKFFPPEQKRTNSTFHNYIPSPYIERG